MTAIHYIATRIKNRPLKIDFYDDNGNKVIVKDEKEQKKLIRRIYKLSGIKKEPSIT